MSHNKINVGSAGADAQGVINVDVQDLSDVTITTPQDGQVLRYNSASSEWKNQFAGFESLFAGDGASQAYSTSSASSVLSGSVVEFYAANLINNISDAQVTSNLDWVQSVTLGEGVYIVEAVVGLTFSSSSGVASYRIYSGASPFGSSGIVGYDDQDVGSRALGRVEVATGNTTSITVRLTSSTSANIISAQGNRHAERGFLEIRRV
jgi:hypothetical protein